jgi:hypothetical protein
MCGESAVERALTGRQRPRTLHALCEQAARLLPCGQCSAAREHL